MTFYNWLLFENKKVIVVLLLNKRVEFHTVWEKHDTKYFEKKWKKSILDEIISI
jgi:hypothetical protein